MPDIIPAARWSQESWRRLADIPLPAPRVWVHHGASGSATLATLRAYDRYHVRTLGWSALGYSFAIVGDGTIYEGRGWGKAGAHTAGDNTRSHGIVLVGDWSSGTVPRAMVEALVDLVRDGHQRGLCPLEITGGHQEAPRASTSCPGGGGMRAIRRARELLASPPSDQEEDVMWGPVDKGDGKDNGRDSLVACVQRLANEAGADPPLAIDGEYGRLTAAAVAQLTGRDGERAHALELMTMHKMAVRNWVGDPGGGDYAPKGHTHTISGVAE